MDLNVWVFWLFVSPCVLLGWVQNSSALHGTDVVVCITSQRADQVAVSLVYIGMEVCQDLFRNGR